MISKNICIGITNLITHHTLTCQEWQNIHVTKKNHKDLEENWQARDKAPMCNDCCGAKATRRPWRTGTAKGNASHIKTATNPGDVVSVDHLESSIPGFIGQMTGRLVKQRIVGSTVYVDHASGFSYVYHQT